MLFGNGTSLAKRLWLYWYLNTNFKPTGHYKLICQVKKNTTINKKIVILFFFAFYLTSSLCEQQHIYVSEYF